MSQSTSISIEAAGAVVVRAGALAPEVLVVHRPYRADWSLPKGKLETGERHEVAAVREVHEETGVHCTLGPALPSSYYQIDGVAKRVKYWRASVSGVDSREPDSEVDEVRWVTGDEAQALLTYPSERDVVNQALGIPTTTALVILRHAEATKRAAWIESGHRDAAEDDQRPLNAEGERHATYLVPLLAAYGLTTVISSDAARCRTSVLPFANSQHLEIAVEPAFSERACVHDPNDTVEAVRQQLGHAGAVLWCTHRPVLPILLKALATELGLATDSGDLRAQLDPRLKPGAAIVVHRDDEGTVIAIDRLEF